MAHLNRRPLNRGLFLVAGGSHVKRNRNSARKSVWLLLTGPQLERKRQPELSQEPDGSWNLIIGLSVVLVTAQV